MKLSIEEQIQKYTNEWAIKNGGMPFLNVKAETLEGIQTRGFYHDKYVEDLLKTYATQVNWIETLEHSIMVHLAMIREKEQLITELIREKDQRR